MFLLLFFLKYKLTTELVQLLQFEVFPVNTLHFTLERIIVNLHTSWLTNQAAVLGHVGSGVQSGSSHREGEQRKFSLTRQLYINT